MRPGSLVTGVEKGKHRIASAAQQTYAEVGASSMEYVYEAHYYYDIQGI